MFENTSSEPLATPINHRVTSTAFNKANKVTDVYKQTSVPDYLESVYHWSYLSPKNVYRLDREWIVRLILWGQHVKLREAVFRDIPKGSKVVQCAAVYGKFSPLLAEHLGESGHLTVLDIAPIQTLITKDKLAPYTNTEVQLDDASSAKMPANASILLSYFLLHEVPDDYKQTILNNLLKQIPPKGKLILVDYHRPNNWHPLKAVMSLVFDTLEPFAKAFWNREIKEFAEDSDRFKWEKTTFFGGMYQKVVVTRV